MKGKFITFEGADGAGKTTQAARLAVWLREQAGLGVVETREPGGTKQGLELREIILNGNNSPVTETLLLFAARQEHLRQKILPALANGDWVICDRFSDSSIAYQGGGRGVSVELLSALIHHVQDGLNPDLTIYLKSPALLSASPLLKPDAFEQENTEFYHRVCAEYDALAKREKRIATVAAMKKNKRRSEEEVAAEILQLVKKRFSLTQSPPHCIIPPL